MDDPVWSKSILCFSFFFPSYAGFAVPIAKRKAWALSFLSSTVLADICVNPIKMSVHWL